MLRKTKYMVMSRDQNAGRCHNIKTDDRSFDRMENFTYSGTILTNQYCIREEIRSRLMSGNACCHSVQDILSSSLIFKNIKLKTYRTITLPVVLNGCETWSLT
jgi:hypothetical protein